MKEGFIMKKVLSMLMAFVLCAVSFCSCGNNETSSELAKVKENGKLIIGITEFAPLNFKATDGSWTGFETEFAQAVCAELGVTAEFQVINWDSKISELNGKTIDCIWNGMTITPEIESNTSISTPYLENKQVVVVKAENADKVGAGKDLTGLSVVAEQGSAGETTVEKENAFKGVKYTAVESQTTALLEVFSGTADAAVIDYIASLGTIGEGTDYANLTAVVYDEFEGEQYGIAFRKGSDLQTEVNTVITKLVNNGKLAEIAKKYKLEGFVIAK